jgi:putative Holliday junction resolvase
MCLIHEATKLQQPTGYVLPKQTMNKILCIFVSQNNKFITIYMARIMAIDYGQKRTGIAVTDPQQIIATGLETIPSHTVIDFITKYLIAEQVECIVVGEPKDMQNNASDSSRFVEPFVKNLRKRFPAMQIERFDERFTSKMAFQSMIDAGLSRKRRQDKALVDTISATIILQSYLENRNR